MLSSLRTLKRTLRGLRELFKIWRRGLRRLQGSIKLSIKWRPILNNKMRLSLPLKVIKLILDKKLMEIWLILKDLLMFLSLLRKSQREWRAYRNLKISTSMTQMIMFLRALQKCLLWCLGRTLIWLSLGHLTPFLKLFQLILLLSLFQHQEINRASSSLCSREQSSNSKGIKLFIKLKRLMPRLSLPKNLKPFCQMESPKKALLLQFLIMAHRLPTKSPKNPNIIWIRELLWDPQSLRQLYKMRVEALKRLLSTPQSLKNLLKTWKASPNWPVTRKVWWQKLLKSSRMTSSPHQNFQIWKKQPA